MQKRYNSKFNLHKKDRIAICKVEKTCKMVIEGTDDRRCLTATHEPEPDDDSHSGLWGFSLEDILIGELICQSVIRDFPAKIA